MTEDQNRKLKHTLWQNAHTGVRVEQQFPSVAKIVIHHVRGHSSVFGSSHKEGTWIVTPQSEACFIIACLNPECSSIGFDLGNVIRTAILQHQAEITGEMRCNGQEAPDHPEQSCEGYIEYTISITYKEQIMN